MSSLVIGTLYGQMSFMCLLILGVICFRILKADDRTFKKYHFAAVGMLTAAAVIVDYISGLGFYGIISMEQHTADIVNVIYFILIALLSFHWFLYSEAEQNSVFVRLKSGKIAYMVAEVAIFVMMGAVMYIDWSRLKYEFMAETIISFMPALYSCMRALHKSFKAEYYEARNNYRIIATFAVLPLVLIVIQIFTPMIPSFVCGITISYMMVYSNRQKAMISKDALTGINNREAFDKYISSKIRDISDHSKLYIIMLDIDHFKEINKKYGPIEGDKALKATAFSLKELGAEYDFYAARYDADDFAAVVDTTSDNMIGLICRNIKEHATETGEKMQMKCPLSVTLGMVEYHGQDIPAWLNEAAMALENAKVTNRGLDVDEVQDDINGLLNEYEKTGSNGEEFDVTGLDERIFPVFSEASQKMYIFVTNMQTDVTRWSKNAVEFLGLDSEYDYATRDRWKSRIHPDDIVSYQKEIDAVYAGKKKTFTLTYRIKDRNGSYISCTGHGQIIKGDSQRPDLFAGTIVNHGIADRVDSVTNLWNMDAFNMCLEEYIFKYESVAILLIGISKFSHINDTYGYTLGNELLKNFGAELLQLVGGELRVFRVDGAKFAFVMAHTGQEEMRELYRQVKNIAETGIDLGESKVQLRLAAGAAMVTNYTGSSDIVKNSATYALDSSKHEKHGELVFFDSAVDDYDLKKLEQIAEIHRSVIAGCQGFFLCYQPIVSVETGRIVGAEALIRWKNEKYGLVPPDSFIPWLEEDPCIYTLGNWIIENALIAAKRFKKVIPEFFINVNIAATQLENTAFRTDVLDMVKRLDFPKEDLWIELTERCKDLDHDFLKREISFFKEHGIQIALDDYGTGSASLSLALELPVGEIKIDRSFTKDVMSDELKQAIVESILVFTGRIRMRSCIEGIETHEMAEYLKKFGPMYYQGYAYSKPIEEEAFMTLIKEQARAHMPQK